MYGLGSITGTARDVSTLYYDPLIDLHIRQKAGGHLGLSRELLGQNNEEARLLFNGAAEFLGWTNLEPLREASIDFITGARTPFATTVGLSLAKEFDDKAVYAKIMAHAEDNYEPTWDTASGEFTWRFGPRRTPSQGPVQWPDGDSGGLFTRSHGAHLRRSQPQEIPGADGVRSGLPHRLSLPGVLRCGPPMPGDLNGPGSPCCRWPANLVPGQQRGGPALQDQGGRPALRGLAYRG